MPQNTCEFTQFITLISSHLHLKDSSTEVYMLPVSLSISIDDAVRFRSLKHTKSEQAHSLQGVLSTDIKQASSQ